MLYFSFNPQISGDIAYIYIYLKQSCKEATTSTMQLEVILLDTVIIHITLWQLVFKDKGLLKYFG